MKNLLLTLSLFFSQLSFSQELNISLSSGYNHKIAANTFGIYYFDYLIGAFYPYSVEYSTYSLGKGINSNIGISFSTKKNVGFQLEGSYLFGLSTINISDYYINDLIRKEIYSRYYRIIPQVYFIHSLNHIQLKFHFGAIINWGSFTLTQEQYDENNNYGFRYVHKFYGGVSSGIITGLSTIYKLTNRFSLFLDLNLISASHSPLKRKYLEKYQNGINQTNNSSISVNETIYVDQIDINEPHDPNSPGKALKFKTPNSSVGLQIGVNFQLWKKEEKQMIN